MVPSRAEAPGLAAVLSLAQECPEIGRNVSPDLMEEEDMAMMPVYLFNLAV